MIFEIFSLFPEAMQEYLSASILGRALSQNLIQVNLHNIRDYAEGRHRVTDDEPYGGGGGMVMKPEPIFAAVETVLAQDLESTPIVLLSPQGRVFQHEIAKAYAAESRIALICGRYEGVDERIRAHLVSDEISIGDYVLTGGELPALVIIDGVTRFIPGALGDERAPYQDSHASGLLEHPHYTRPEKFRSWPVPDILRSGDHARIAAWRREQSIRRTFERRPDLLENAALDPAERERVNRWGAGVDGSSHAPQPGPSGEVSSLFKEGG